jgi:hypothetical protein
MIPLQTDVSRVLRTIHKGILVMKAEVEIKDSTKSERTDCLTSRPT